MLHLARLYPLTSNFPKGYPCLSSSRLSFFLVISRGYDLCIPKRPHAWMGSALSLLALLQFLIISEQGASHFHFALQIEQLVLGRCAQPMAQHCKYQPSNMSWLNELTKGLVAGAIMKWSRLTWSGVKCNYEKGQNRRIEIRGPTLPAPPAAPSWPQTGSSWIP